MSSVDHYGEAELELERADRARNDAATGRVPIDPARQWQHISRAGIHALLALVDAIDDAGIEGIKLVP